MYFVCSFCNIYMPKAHMRHRDWRKMKFRPATGGQDWVMGHRGTHHLTWNPIKQGSVECHRRDLSTSVLFTLKSLKSTFQKVWQWFLAFWGDSSQVISQDKVWIHEAPTTWQKFPVESVDLEGLSMGSPSSHGVVPASQRLAVAAVLRP